MCMFVHICIYVKVRSVFVCEVVVRMGISAYVCVCKYVFINRCVQCLYVYLFILVRGARVRARLLSNDTVL